MFEPIAILEAGSNGLRIHHVDITIVAEKTFDVLPSVQIRCAVVRLSKR